MLYYITNLSYYSLLTGAYLKTKYNYVNDTVQFIAKHIESENLEIKLVPAERDLFIKECLIHYHNTQDEVKRKELRDNILMNVWYLFPYILSFCKLKNYIFEDALQLMILTTMKAIDNFRPHLGYKFSSYISGYLKDAISTSLKASMVVKCPNSVAKQQEIIRLQSLLSDTPEEEDHNLLQSKYVELNIDEDITLTEVAKDIVCKNKPSSFNCTSVEEDIIYNEQSELLRKAIGRVGLLTRKERLVLIYRFGLSGVPRLTLSQVANIFKTNGDRASKVWIFQIEQKAKAKLKRYFKRNNLV